MHMQLRADALYQKYNGLISSTPPTLFAEFFNGFFILLVMLYMPIYVFYQVFMYALFSSSNMYAFSFQYIKMVKILKKFNENKRNTKNEKVEFSE